MPDADRVLKRFHPRTHSLPVGCLLKERVQRVQLGINMHSQGGNLVKQREIVACQLCFWFGDQLAPVIASQRFIRQ